MDKRLKISRLIAWAPVLALGFFILAPQAALFAYSFISRSDGSFTLGGFHALVNARGFTEALLLSLLIAVCTVFGLIIVLVPAVVAVHLWAPRLTGVLNIICTLPLVVPTIALVAGLMSTLRMMSSGGRGSLGLQVAQVFQSDDFPLVLIGSYIVLALPFSYRSINAAVESIPLRTYFEASHSLGASTLRTLTHIVFPNIRGAIVFSAFFAFALSLGEYTMAATMGYATLPVWMTILSTSDFRASIVLSLLLNIFTWTLLAAVTLYAERFGRASATPRRKENS